MKTNCPGNTGAISAIESDQLYRARQQVREAFSCATPDELFWAEQVPPEK